jgi:hypothetical protein
MRILGRILFRTDHRTLRVFAQKKQLTPRRARWAIEITPHRGNFRFEWLPGTNNPIADALSLVPRSHASEQEPRHDRFVCKYFRPILVLSILNANSSSSKTRYYWESMWANLYTPGFHLFVAFAILEAHRDLIIRFPRGFDEILKVPGLSSSCNRCRKRSVRSFNSPAVSPMTTKSSIILINQPSSIKSSMSIL